MSIKFHFELLTQELNHSLKEQLNQIIKDKLNEQLSSMLSSKSSPQQQSSNTPNKQQPTTLHTTTITTTIPGGDNLEQGHVKKVEENIIEFYPPNLNYLIIEDLNLGNISPHFEIKEIQYAPNESDFLEKSKYFENKLMKRVYNNNLNVNNNNISLNGSNNNLLLNNNNLDNSDVLSMISSVSSINKFSTLSKRNNQLHPLILRSISLSSNMSDVYSMISEIPHHHNNNQHNTTINTSLSLDTLSKPPLKTHLCSIGTVYKKNKNGKETKRRQDWWKNRLTNLEQNGLKKDTNHFISPLPDNKGLELLNFDNLNIDNLLNYLLDNNGIKLRIQFSYLGNLNLKLATELSINIPIPKFITVPINIDLNKINIEGDLSILFYNHKDKKHVYIYFENSHLNTNIEKHDRFINEKEIIKTIKEYSPLKDLEMSIQLGAPLSKDQLPFEGEDKVLEDKNEIANFIKETIHKLVKDLLIYPNVFFLEIPNNNATENQESMNTTNLNTTTNSTTTV
ncbi:hypothetical protein ABK040_007320 [Willaertia magna]